MAQQAHFLDQYPFALSRQRAHKIVDRHLLARQPSINTQFPIVSHKESSKSTAALAPTALKPLARFSILDEKFGDQTIAAILIEIV